MKTLSRPEAAILDLHWPTDLIGNDGRTYKAKAVFIERFARTPVTGPRARDLIDELQRRKLLGIRDEGLHVTRTGRAALMHSAGLGNVAAAPELMMPLALADQLEPWFGRWMGSRLWTLLEASAVPFEMPPKSPKSKGDHVADGLLKLWQAQGRAWKILAVVQDACEQAWWITRSMERTEAIFEANKLLHHIEVLVSWQSGRISDIGADEVHHERLAVERELKSSHPAQTRSDETAGQQKREDVDWDASDDAPRDELIISLLRDCGLYDVRSCSSPDRIRRRGRSRKPSRSLHATDPQAESPEQRVISELARVYHERDQAVVLLGKVGFPKERMPPFTSSLVFWTKVVEEAHHGVLEGGASPIIEAAANMYPSNPVFTKYCRETSSSPMSSSAVPMIDIVGWYPSPLDHRRWVAVDVERAIRANETVALQQRIRSTFPAPIPERVGEAFAEVWVIVTARLPKTVRSTILDGLDPVMRANVRLFDRGDLEGFRERVLTKGAKQPHM